MFITRVNNESSHFLLVPYENDRNIYKIKFDIFLINGILNSCYKFKIATTPFDGTYRTILILNVPSKYRKIFILERTKKHGNIQI